MLGFVVAQLEAQPTLVDVAPGGVHEGQLRGVDDDVVGIVVQHQAPIDDTRQRRYRVMARALFVVRASVAGESYDELEPAADLIDAALHGASGAGDDGLWFESVRVSPVGYPEVAGSKQYRHLGGMYRLLAHTT